jgi:hypothetical protein
MSDQLTSFTVFPKLPNKVQFKIWRFASSEPQIIEVVCVRTEFGPKFFINFTWTSSVVPPILHVSKTARAEGLRHYSLMKIDGYYPFYTNFNTNLLYFKGFYPSCSLKDFKGQTDATLIKNVALHTGSWKVGNGGVSILEGLRNYPHLESITFLLDTPGKGHITSLRTAEASELGGEIDPAAVTGAFKKVEEETYRSRWLSLRSKGNFWSRCSRGNFWSRCNVPTVNFKIPDYTFPYDCPKFPYPSRACKGCV